MKRNVMRYFKYVFLLAAIGTITGFYFYNEPVKSTASKNADLIIQANDLFAAYEKNEIEANRKYLDKVISVVGTVTSIAKEDNIDLVTLKTSSGMFGVVCKLESGHNLKAPLKVNDQIKVKGICSGMLMDVVMMRCIVE